MRTIQFILPFFLFITSFAQAQDKSTSDNQRTIEINNSNGELYISFENSVITEFIINDEPVAKERYADYQEIIDDFSDEEIVVTSHSVSISSASSSDENSELRDSMVEYLMKEGIIASTKKYHVQLKKEYLKVDRKNISKEIHDQCLNLFDEIYGHRLNSTSAVMFKKSRNNSSSSINIQK